MTSGEERDIALIAAYFDLLLSEDELRIFEQRLSEDDQFADKVRTYQTSIHIVDGIHPQSDENTRKKEWKKLLEKPRRAKKRSFVWMSRVAAFLVIALATYFYFNVQSSNYDSQLQEAWDREVGLDFTYRNGTKDTISLVLSDALSAYKKGQYDETLWIVKEIDQTSKGYKEALILRALAKYQLNRPDATFMTLDTLETYNVNVARWYKGLIYLQQNDVVKAGEFLDIPESSNEKIKLKME